MKKFYKIGAFTIVIGIILAIIGFANHGFKTISGNKFNNFHVVTQRPKPKKKVINVPKFKQIDIDVDEADVYIHRGNKFQVTTTNYSDTPITAKVSNQKQLSISGKESSYWINFGNSNHNSRIEITLPKKAALTKITSKNDEGDLILEYLTMDQLDLDIDEGDISLNNVTINKKGTFNSSEGNFTIDSSRLTNSDFDSDEGDIDIKNSKIQAISTTQDEGDLTFRNCSLSGHNSATLSEGDFRLNPLPKNTSFNLRTDDDTIIFGNRHVSSHFIKNTNNSKNKLAVTSDDGEIIIR
ncbi:DUF4097 family beta strand repeat-containing protein [Lactobacillus sp. ESL0684]|uniref:DUF4097 family beta strand repeat-containing protein n=1 Tax=Lactobacillus sp. ESL0684 TaxID=2983213 RepID=UPI0023F9037B|nr:DUF4097 family beta strand repeat-containing protein [Lactobacillus sp. ESL0684]WEV43730.1 DUF4097 family beta strand repeat-containing protein [Lactobacillus sp. ESL0684]